MADLYPNINFPKVDFGILGDLPATIEQARINRARQSLADLDLSTVGGLDKAAGRLAALGDLEGAKTLYAQSTARRGVEQRAASDLAYMKWLESGKGNPPKVGPPGGEEPVPFTVVPPPGLGAPPGASQPTDPFANVPSRGLPLPATPGLRSEVTPPVPTSPSEELLARLEGGGPATPPSGPQLAQAGPVNLPPIDVAPTPPAPPAMFTPGAMRSQLQAGPIQAPAGPPPATAAPPPPPARAATPQDDVSSARQEAQQILNQMFTMPPRAASSEPGKALSTLFNNAIQRAKLSPSDQDYMLELKQRAQMGEPFITKTDFETYKKVAPERYKEAADVYKDIENKAIQARDSKPHLDRLDQIMKDPNFASGEWSDKYAGFVGAMDFVAKAAGITFPAGYLKNLVSQYTDPHTRRAALLDEAQSITNALVLTRAGGKFGGQAFSDKDREAITRIVPNILQTEGGMARVSQYLRAIGTYQEEVANEARKYMKSRDIKATPEGLYSIMKTYADEHPLFIRPDGTVTALGEHLAKDAARPKVTPPPSIDFAADPIGAAVTYSMRAAKRALTPPSQLDTSITPNMGPFPGMAKGGPVKAGQAYTVGERGPETFVPKVDGRIFPHHEGKVYYHMASGKPAGRIKNGKPVPFGQR